MTIDKDDPCFSPMPGCGHCHFFKKRAAQILGVDIDADAEANGEHRGYSLIQWPVPDEIVDGIREDVKTIVSVYDEKRQPAEAMTWHERINIVLRLLDLANGTGNQKMIDMVTLLSQDVVLAEAMERAEKQRQEQMMATVFAGLFTEPAEEEAGSDGTKH